MENYNEYEFSEDLDSSETSSRLDAYANPLSTYLAPGVSVKTDLLQAKPYTMDPSEISEDLSADSGFQEEMNEEGDEEDNCSYDENLNHSYTEEPYTGEPYTASLNSNYEDLLALDEGVVKKGLFEAEIKKFPTYTYLSSNKTANPEGCCIICIASFEVGEIVREIICGHEFHRDCIDKWLSGSIKCPSCNKYLK